MQRYYFFSNNSFINSLNCSSGVLESFLSIKLIAFIFSVIEKKNAAKVTPVITPINSDTSVPQTNGVALPDNESQGQLELIGVDEATAAMLMALVSYKTEIPLNRLAFRSIKFVEEVE